MENTERPKQQLEDDKEYEIIDENAIVDIKCAFHYYQRVFAAADYIIRDIPTEKIDEYHKLIIEKQPLTEEWMIHYNTLLVFCSTFQKECKDKGHLVKMLGKDIAEKFKEE